MKTSLVIAGSLLVGILLGVGTTAARFELAGGGRSLADAEQPDLAPAGGPQPKVEVDEEDYDFGAMERGATQSHSFVFTNVGDYPLKLVQGDTTCKCTISKLDAQAAAPGESVEVTLEWTAKTAGDRFRQSATILTNDPQRPRVNLTVSGAVSQSVEVQPDDIVFSKAQVGETKTAQVRLVSYLEEALQLVEHRFAQQQSAEFFDLSVEPIPQQELPHDAKSGLLVTITLKPGLPVGPVNQQLELTTNARGSSLVVIPIHGRVVSNISIFGPGWDAATGVLRLGTIDSGEGLRHELSIFARGERPEDVTFELAEATPNVLKVSFGEKQVIRAGEVVKTPLLIEIPPGTRAVNHLGSEQGKMGEILIETNHAQAEKLRLYVHFAVER